MKSWGYGLVTVGIVYLIYAFNMDVSVTTAGTYVPGYGNIGGGQVANLDLMARRQNHIIVASLVTAIGAAMAIFGKDESGEEDASASPTNRPVIPSEFDGQRQLSNDKYRLWLAKHYDIQRNDVFDRFVFDDRTFETLDTALAEAHALEEQKRSDAAAAELERLENAEQEREDQRIRQEEAEAEWQENKPKVVVGLLLGLAVVVALVFFARETPEEREARLVQERSEREAMAAQFSIRLPDDATLVDAGPIGDREYLCDEITEGSLLEFETELTEKELKDFLAESLGKGHSVYDGLVDDNYNWAWENAGVKYSVFMIELGGKTSVNFCMDQAIEGDEATGA